MTDKQIIEISECIKGMLLTIKAEFRNHCIKCNKMPTISVDNCAYIHDCNIAKAIVNIDEIINMGA